MRSPAHASATELVRAISSSEISSRELLELYLRRIEDLDGPVNSVVTLESVRARAEADRADADARRGHRHGPLHGLPITVKDALATAGIRSTGGARELADHVPSVDATAVARLRAAGAIVFGKTNLPRWSGDMQTYNEVFGVTSNPWDLATSPGGSSGGAAAAVACGFTAFEVGTDIGGSIRIPSHLCGTFGLRPSYGLVPQDGYLAGTTRGLAGLDPNVVGPITRSAEDLNLVLDVLAGPSTADAVAWHVSLPPAKPRDRLRVGLWLDDPFCAVDSEYHAILTRLADRLSEAGIDVVDSRPDVSFQDSFEAYWTLLAAANGLNESSPLTHAEWLKVNDRRLEQRRAWSRWFERFDALLCPVLAVSSYPHDHTGTFATRTVPVNGGPRTHVDIARWTGLIGALGLPVAVAPAGQTSTGKPVGVQIISGRWHDRTAVELAAVVAEVSGGHRPPPGFGDAISGSGK